MAASANVVEITDKDFEAEVIKSSLPVLVDFGATWCGPCKALAPIVGKIADDFKGKIKVVAVDIDDAPETAKKYGIRSVPTCIVFQGGEKKGQQVGLASRETLLKLLNLS
jgi:thioredoxin 1